MVRGIVALVPTHRLLADAVAGKVPEFKFGFLSGNNHLLFLPFFQSLYVCMNECMYIQVKNYVSNEHLTTYRICIHTTYVHTTLMQLYTYIYTYVHTCFLYSIHKIHTYNHIAII